MFNFWKIKVHFLSEKPPIKSCKGLLKNTELWFNELIKNDGFFIDENYVRQGFTPIASRFEKTFKSIYDAFIQKQSLSAGSRRFDFVINLGASWSSDYHYSTFYEETNKEDGFLDEVFVNENEMIWNQPEVPLPRFSYNFSLFEWTKDTRKTNNLISRSKFPDGNQSFQNPVKLEEKGYDLSDPIRSLDKLKKEYHNFCEEADEMLLNYGIKLSEVNNKNHPVNLEFKKNKQF